LYRYGTGTVPCHPTRARIDEEHKVIFDAALARDADVVDLLTQYLETTTRHLGAIAPEEDASCRRSKRLPAPGPGPGGAAPVR
jgi:hypothetical protein